MKFEGLRGKIVESVLSRTEQGSVTLEIEFSDRSTFAFQISPVPVADGRLFDATGEVVRKWE